jgi:hypothetical protein
VTNPAAAAGDCYSDVMAMDATHVPVGVRALGLHQNDHLRGPVALAMLAGLIAVPADADGAGVATVVDGSSLVSRVKLASSTTLASLVGTPKGRTAVVQVGIRHELRPTSVDQTANLGPFRARTWAGAVVGGPQDPDEAAARRAQLVATLPDPLRRCVVGNSEGEAFFLAVLALLHAQGALERPDGPLRLVEAIQFLDRDAKATRQVVITNGADVVMHNAGRSAAVIVVDGLPDDIADAVSPLLADSSTARERNRRYHGTFCVGALDVPLTIGVPLPRGCAVHVLPEHAAVLVGREPKPRLL